MEIVSDGSNNGWLSTDPVILLERVKVPSPCVTPEHNNSGNDSDSGDDEKASGDNEKVSGGNRRKAREEERRKREVERRKRLEAAEEAKRKKEEEKKRKEEERKKREEEKKKKDEEKEEERKRREEERKKREEEKKKKEEEKEEEKKRREEERKKREEEKEEERKRKEEEKRKKDEERKKKEDERLKAIEEKRKQVEAEERKKARVSQSFINFFKRTSTGSESTSKKPKLESEAEPILVNSIFKPFQLKPFQTLAVNVSSFSKPRFSSNQFEEIISAQNLDEQDCYVARLKSGQINPIKLNKSELEQIKEEKSSVLIIEEPTPKKTFKAKFLDLSDIRPAYYGTWRKRSKIVNGRRPWARDIQLLDYDVDSEEEWEGEDEDGESIASSGSDSSRNGADDFEMDDFLVPHGHLSGDEEACEGEDEDEDDEGPKKHITLIKEEDLLKARSKTSKLKPIIIGPYWEDDENKDPDIAKLLDSFKIIQNY